MMEKPLRFGGLYLFLAEMHEAPFLRELYRTEDFVLRFIEVEGECPNGDRC